MSTTADPTFLDPKYSIVASFRDLKKDIDRSLSDISGAAITADASGQAITDLKKSYTTLKDKINVQHEAWSKTDLTILSSTLQDYTSQKSALDTTRKTLISPTGFDISLGGLAHRVAQQSLENFATASVIIAFILGGSVMSNNFIEKPVLLRVFYFIYGAALFPASLIYGIILTPTWHSAIFPLFERTQYYIPFFSYAKPSAIVTMNPTGGHKIILLISCIISLLMVIISISLLSS